MQRKKLFSILLVLVIAGAGFFGFFSGNGPGDKTTMSDYLTNGGQFTVTNNGNLSDLPAAWTAGTNMPAPTRYQGSGALWHSPNYDTLKLFCHGGDNNGSGSADATTSIYNYTTNTWSTGAPVGLARFYGSACCIGDTTYFLGGWPSPGSFRSEVTNNDRCS